MRGRGGGRGAWTATGGGHLFGDVFPATDRGGAIGHDRELKSKVQHKEGILKEQRRQAAGGRAHAVGLQHPEGVHAAPGAAAARRHADLRQDVDGQDDHSRGRAVGHDREREEQDPGQGGHPAGPAAADLPRQAAGGQAHAVGQQHPEGEHPAPGAPAAWTGGPAAEPRGIKGPFDGDGSVGSSNHLCQVRRHDQREGGQGASHSRCTTKPQTRTWRAQHGGMRGRARCPSRRRRRWSQATRTVATWTAPTWSTSTR